MYFKNSKKIILSVVEQTVKKVTVVEQSVKLPGTHFTAESTEAMQIMCLAQGHNILMSGFEQSTSISGNRHSNQTTNMLHSYIYAKIIVFQKKLIFR